jgi:hypothetical protein
MLQRYAGYDETETPIIPRGPASRFSDEQIGEMMRLAADGASGVEIAHQLNLKPEAVRARLWRLGVQLRRRITKTRLRMVIHVTKRTYAAAEARGVSVQVLIRRLLAAVSKQDLFDEILPMPVAHSLGAAAVNEMPHTVVILIRAPQLAGVTSLRG